MSIVTCHDGKRLSLLSLQLNQSANDLLSSYLTFDICSNHRHSTPQNL